VNVFLLTLYDKEDEIACETSLPSSIVLLFISSLSQKKATRAPIYSHLQDGFATREAVCLSNMWHGYMLGVLSSHVTSGPTCFGHLVQIRLVCHLSVTLNSVPDS
jgi:hypothetical protein